MFLDSIGIILKKHDLSPYKITVLDKLQGKIECITTNGNLSVGALITYNMRQQGLTTFLAENSLIYIPLALARADMLFFHHIIELSYYFTQIGDCSKKLFDLLSFLYSTEDTIMTQQYKKCFLFKLLSSMDITPEVVETPEAFIMQLTSLSLEQLNEVNITISDEKELDRWLWCCVWQHPYVNEFKTVHFLTENRTL